MKPIVGALSLATAIRMISDPHRREKAITNATEIAELIAYVMRRLADSLEEKHE